MHESLRSEVKNFFSRGIHALPKPWNTCIKGNGDCIEKWSNCLRYVFNKLRDKNISVLRYSFDSPLHIHISPCTVLRTSKELLFCIPHSLLAVRYFWTVNRSSASQEFPPFYRNQKVSLPCSQQPNTWSCPAATWPQPRRDAFSYSDPSRRGKPIWHSHDTECNFVSTE